MAFPWVLEQGFEAGTLGTFDSEVDTTGILDFPHYSELASQGMTPYRGAYAMRVRLNGGTTSAYVQEDTSFDDLTANVVRFLRFYFYLGRDLVMVDGNRFSLFEAESVLDTTTEVACGVDRSGDALLFWYAETAAAAAQTLTLGDRRPGVPGTALGKWYSAELRIDLDNAAANDGTLDGYLNDLAGTQITALDQGVIVDAKFGVIGPDAGTSGTVLIDDILYDDLRIYARRERFPVTAVMTATGHVFVGPGTVDSAELVSTTAGNILQLYDTDSGSALDAQGFVAELAVDAETDVMLGPFYFQRGCYALLTGTSPRAAVHIGGALYYGNDAALIRYGAARRVRGQNI